LILQEAKHTPEHNGKIEACWKVFDNRCTDRDTKIKDYNMYGMAVHAYNLAHHHSALAS
jgi:hypothetical protein